MEEPLSDGRVVTIAHGRDHVPAVVAQMLHGFLARDVTLVGEEDHENENEDPDDEGHREALHAELALEREMGRWVGHRAGIPSGP